MVAKAVASHPARLWKQYNRALKSSPLMTKSVTCSVAYALGDGIAQVATCKAPTVEKRLLSLDVLRMARLALFGLLWSGPSGHAFYRWLDKAFHSLAFGRVASIAGKVGIDQLCYSPVCTIAFFAWVNAACCTPEKIPTEICQKLAPSTKASWALWVPVMTLNMALVPAQLRMLFINVISLFWTYKLSTMSAASPCCNADILSLTSQIEQDLPMAPTSVEDILADVSPDHSFGLETPGCSVSVALPVLEPHELVLTVEGAAADAMQPTSDEIVLSVGIHEDVTVALA